MSNPLHMYQQVTRNGPLICPESLLPNSAMENTAVDVPRCIRFHHGFQLYKYQSTDGFVFE